MQNKIKLDCFKHPILGADVALRYLLQNNKYIDAYLSVFPPCSSLLRIDANLHWAKLN